MAEPVDPLQLLEWAKDLGRSYPFLDFHTHPFNVLTEETDYKPCLGVEGLFAKTAAAYRPPTYHGAAEMQHQPDERNGAATGRALLLASRFAYAHTGSRVFLDQLNAAGIAGALLLPVARSPGTAQTMLESCARMFQDEGRLLPGCAFPAGVSPDAVGSFIHAARKAYGVLAVKIHPNLAGLDPLASRGRESIEAALAAAGNLGLPVIVHAGRTPGIEPMESGDYAALSRLAEINWGVSSAPVIIAHAGCYGLEEGAAKAQAPVLEGLFRRHSNLLADTSALPLQALCHILSIMDRNRLVFGSDALYQPIWKAWLVFLRALRQISSSPDDDLVRIASVNPARCLAATMTQDAKSLI